MVLSIKHLHIACVVLSGLGFLVRGIWMLRASPMLTRRWVRVAPHGVDTLLLASAIALAVQQRQYPWVDAWLTAKVVGLTVYIGLGLVALRFGRGRLLQAAAWIAALMVFAWIVSVAITRSPLGFMVVM